MREIDTTILPERWLVIPPAQLSEKALEGVLQEYISREGTDYGLQEVPLKAQLERAKRAMLNGECILVFDRELECCQLLSQRQRQLHEISEQTPPN